MKNIATIGGSIFLIVSLACATKSPQEPTSSAPAPSAPTPATSMELSLETALVQAQKKGWGHLQLIYECRRDDYWTELWLFGNGVAIWNQERQTKLDEEQIRQILAAMSEAEFSRMAEVYGGKGTEGPPAQAGVSVRCSLALELDGQSHHASQLVEGYQHAPLQALADRLFDISHADKPGVQAENLVDGLRKIGRGELAIEAMTIIAHIKPELEESGVGWLMQLVKGEASNRSFTTEKGYGQATKQRPSPQEIRRLAQTLAEGKIDQLPINLWSKDYREIKVRVLQHETSTTARPFGGRTEPRPEQAEAQQRFSKLFSALTTFQNSL